MSPKNRVSSHCCAKKSSDHLSINHLPLKNSWHSSFVPSGILEVVDKKEKPGVIAGLLVSVLPPRLPMFPDSKPFIWKYLAVSSLQ
jgi:hypothetical protein